MSFEFRVVASSFNSSSSRRWTMGYVQGILEKYGSVPKYVMPETFHSSNTRMLEEIITR